MSVITTRKGSLRALVGGEPIDLLPFTRQFISARGNGRLINHTDRMVSFPDARILYEVTTDGDSVISVIDHRTETEDERRLRWDMDFIALARWWAKRKSKDPSTQTGAVITRPDGSFVSMGYNGFPRHVADTPERLNNRELKYKMIVHCERNALLFARESLHGCTLYTWPFMSCSVCAGMVIQAGIARHVAPPIPAEKMDRWKEDMDLSMTMFREAGVRVDIIDFAEA